MEPLTDVDDEIVDAVDRLLSQLSQTAQRLDRDALMRLVSSDSSRVNHVFTASHQPADRRQQRTLMPLGAR